MSFEVKYAPKTLDEVVISDPNIFSVLDSYIYNGNKRPLLLHGSFGLGKSSVARLLPSLIEGEPTAKMNIDELDLNSVNAIRSFFYSRTKTTYGRIYHEPLYFVVDESNFKENVSFTLRTICDELQGDIQFIFTTNDLNALDTGLQARFECLHFTPTNPTDWLERVKYIVQSEGVTTLSDATLLNFITNQLNKSSNHRKLLAALELFISNVKRQTIVLAQPTKSVIVPINAPPALKAVLPKK